MRLYQIPFSHNSIKARHVLDLKGASYEIVNINPAFRPEVKRMSGQVLVPMLVDRGNVISGSTPILLYLERLFPTPQLLPEDRRQRAECLVLMGWADDTFMALTRRLAYFQVLTVPGRLGALFFPGMPPAVQRLAGQAAAQDHAGGDDRATAIRGARGARRPARPGTARVGGRGARPRLLPAGRARPGGLGRPNPKLMRQPAAAVALSGGEHPLGALWSIYHAMRGISTTVQQWSCP